MLVSVEAEEVSLLIYDLLCAFLYAYLTATLIALHVGYFLTCMWKPKTLYASIVDKNIWFIIFDLGHRINNN